MKIKFLPVFLLAFVTSLFAANQVGVKTTVKTQGKPQKIKTVALVKKVKKPKYSVTIQSGSLNATLTRLSKQYGWHLIWHVPNDYQWTGKIKLQGNGLPEMLKQLLPSFPVQAVFYEGNKVLVVQPRQIS